MLTEKLEARCQMIELRAMLSSKGHVRVDKRHDRHERHEPTGEKETKLLFAEAHCDGLLKPGALETDSGMAALTLTAVLAEMYVVIPVTGNTRRAELHLVSRLLMTVRTGEFAVSSG